MHVEPHSVIGSKLNVAEYLISSITSMLGDSVDAEINISITVNPKLSNGFHLILATWSRLEYSFVASPTDRNIPL